MPPYGALPIDAVLADLTAALRQEGTAVLVAPPGAGKTTRVPAHLAESGLGPVIVLEPRRIAARAAARRVAAERGWTLGNEVGYHVRFDRKAHRDTQVLFCTEGILLRRLQDDPFLEGVGCLVFDEFHERGLDSDLALAMARRVRTEARDDLRIVVTSATLNAAPIAQWLSAPTVTSEGRIYPVERQFVAAQARGSERERIEDHVLRAVRGHLQAPDNTGDLLVFLPGVGEIRRTRSRLESAGLGAEIHELYGDLPPDQQDAALRASPQSRRIVLSTNVAESSVTVQGVRCVIDSGLARVLRHDPAVGLDRLEVERIDRAAADQRQGRAGREGPGTCIRLWSAADDRTLSPTLEPEVRRLDLTGPVLELACWGETDPAQFPWFEAPPRDALRRARKLLLGLGALDERGQPTARGRALQALPLAPRLAALVVEGAERGAPAEAALAAALLSERSPFRRHRGAPRLDASESDVLDRVRALEEHERGGRTAFAVGDLHRGGARSVLRARDQILRLTKKGGTPRTSSTARDEALLRALLAGFPDRLCRRRADDERRGVLAGGRGVSLGPDCAVTEGELFLAVDVSAGSKESVVRSASSVEREWIDGGRTHTDVEAVFDEKSGRVVGRRRTRLGPIVLEERDHPLQNARETERVLLEAAERDLGRALALEREEVVEVRARLRCLSEWRPELELPAVDDDAIAALLPQLVAGRRSFADLAHAPLAGALLGALNYQQRAAFEKDVPERIQVPSGSRLKLTYEPGRPPVLAVRIQEIFGLAQTPTVCSGRVPVLLHLLAPNGRPQQVTDDLASFWSGTYHLVRKDLRARYPRHSWPEDPLTAEARSRPKRRR